MKLCINCDDFGFDRGVNQGIFQAIEEGVVTSCSVMTDHDGHDDIARLGNYNHLSVGLHFSLTSGKGPLGQKPQGMASFLSAILLGRLSSVKISHELKEQWQALQDSYPGRITHVDCHQHIHALPPVRCVIKQFADTKRIPYQRVPVDMSPGWTWKKLILSAAFAREPAGIPFFGINLMARNFTPDNIRHQMDYLEQKEVAGAVWMVHAGGHGREHKSVDHYPHRKTELDVLLSMKSYLQSKFELVPITRVIP